MHRDRRVRLTHLINFMNEVCDPWFSHDVQEKILVSKCKDTAEICLGKNWVTCMKHKNT